MRQNFKEMEKLCEVLLNRWKDLIIEDISAVIIGKETIANPFQIKKEGNQ